MIIIRVDALLPQLRPNSRFCAFYWKPYNAGIPSSVLTSLSVFQRVPDPEQHEENVALRHEPKQVQGDRVPH
jgi:hypothetical protein